MVLERNLCYMKPIMLYICNFFIKNILINGNSKYFIVFNKIDYMEY